MSVYRYSTLVNLNKVRFAAIFYYEREASSSCSLEALAVFQVSFMLAMSTLWYCVSPSLRTCLAISRSELRFSMLTEIDSQHSRLLFLLTCNGITTVRVALGLNNRYLLWFNEHMDHQYWVRGVLALQQTYWCSIKSKVCTFKRP